MIVGIKDVYLYSGLTETGGSDCAKAKKFLDDAGIEYQHLFYGDPAQHEEVLSAITTWFPDRDPVEDFPFVIYDEKHDDYTTVKKLLYGLAEITESNIVELAELGA